MKNLVKAGIAKRKISNNKKLDHLFTDIYMKRLSVLRAAHDRGVSLSEVAKKLNITQQGLNARYRGNPRLSSLYEIAEARGCDITDLFR